MVEADFVVLHYNQCTEEWVAPVWNACGQSPDRTGFPWRPCRGSGRAPPWVAPGTPQIASGWSYSGSLLSSPGNTENHDSNQLTKQNWGESDNMGSAFKEPSWWRFRAYRITSFRHQRVKFLFVEPVKQQQQKWQMSTLLNSTGTKTNIFWTKI